MGNARPIIDRSHFERTDLVESGNMGRAGSFDASETAILPMEFGILEFPPAMSEFNAFENITACTTTNKIGIIALALGRKDGLALGRVGFGQVEPRVCGL